MGPEDVTTPDYNYVTVGLHAKAYGFEQGETGETTLHSGKGTEVAGVVKLGADGAIKADGVALA